MFYSDKILDIIDNADHFSRGDLQGAIEAQCSKMLDENIEGGGKYRS
jgi:hypothetical protein